MRGINFISFVAITLTTAAMTSGSFAGQPHIAGCDIFPCDSIWNWTVEYLPVAPNSDAYIQSIGASDSVHPDFGSGLWNGAPIGIPFIDVDATQPGVDISFSYVDESDPGPYPIPPNAPIEGGELGDGDRHVLVLDHDTCLLYELYAAYKNADDSWTAGSGAIFDLSSHDLRPDGWTSADAAGLPILPGLVRYQEVASGEIRHALRFTVSQTRRAYVWPARHFASSLIGEQYPPMGQRFRLKKNFDISGFSDQARVILQAMKIYGIILADNGSDWFISGVPDDRWDNDKLRELRQVSGNDFEAVDVTILMRDPNTTQTQPALGDVIRLIRILAGQSLNTVGCDIDNDGHQGLSEVINALQLIADHGR